MQFLQPSPSARVRGPSWLLEVCRYLSHRTAGSSLISSAKLHFCFNNSSPSPWGAVGRRDHRAFCYCSIISDNPHESHGTSFSLCCEAGSRAGPQASSFPLHLQVLCHRCRNDTSCTLPAPTSAPRFPLHSPVAISSAAKPTRFRGSSKDAPSRAHKRLIPLSALRIEAEGCLHTCFYRDTDSELVPLSQGSTCLGLFTCCLEKAILSLEYKRDFRKAFPVPR